MQKLEMEKQDSLNTIVMVKKEVKCEVDFHIPTTEQLSYDIKQEEAPSIPLKTEVEDELPLWNQTSAECHDVTAKLPDGSELVESFVIYEFEPKTKTTTTTTTTATVHTPTPTIIAEPTPKILNSKLRIGHIPDASSATAALPLQPFTCVRKRKASSPVTHAGAALSVPAAIVIPEPTELKVKCFCRLGKPANLDAAPTNVYELNAFFAQMFDEARQLSREQQRKVKMVLLEAVCQAEEDVEAGRHCEKCCS